ncbi:hypothetical protein D3C72_1515370 [compost metagenome]
MSVIFDFSSESEIASLCGSSNFASSSGEYSFVVNSVTRIEPIKTAAPMIKDKVKFKGTLPGIVLFGTPKYFVKIYGNAEPITAPKPIKEV